LRGLATIRTSLKFPSLSSLTLITEENVIKFSTDRVNEFNQDVSTAALRTVSVS